MALLTAAFLIAISVTAQAQQVCDLRNAASLGGCDNVYYAWFTSRLDVVSQRLVYGDGFSPTIGPSARSYSRTGVGCGFHTRVTITQTYANGQSCSVSEFDNHNRPCSQCTNNGAATATIVSAANFRQATTRNSLVSAFTDPGISFSDQVMYAGSLTLPTELAGVTVEVNGQLCGLHSVSPGQVNFHLPIDLPEGPTEVFGSINTTRGSGLRFSIRPQVNPNAPAVFTESANGTGNASSVWLILKPDGRQLYQSSRSLSFAAGDRVFLVLYATGINDPDCELRINGGAYRASYCGASQFTGVQQVNVEIPTNQIWTGTVGATIRVYRGSGFWESQGVNLSGRL